MKKRFYQGIFFIAFNLIVVLIAVEIFSWIVMVDSWPTYFLPHHYPFSQVKTTAGPVSAQWVSNSQGFHDEEQSFIKPTDEVRIVAIGDSFLDGPQEIPLPTQLENNLKKLNPKVNVVNLSRPGIDPYLYYVLFKHAISKYDPDMIVVFIFEGNDFRRMEQFSPDMYDKPSGFFRRYPLASYFGFIFPRTTIFLTDISQKSFVHRWTDTSKYSRHRVEPVRSLPQVSEVIAEYIKKSPDEIENYLNRNLTDEELLELESYGVRLDLLAYVVGIGMQAEFTDKLKIKGQRPEINNSSVAAKQVQSVLTFLTRMDEISSDQNIEFIVVLIPTSFIDPESYEMFSRLDATNDPLFVETRIPQMQSLKELLADNNNINFIDLRDVLSDIPGTYLKFDTHWSIKGVEIVAENLTKYLVTHCNFVQNKKSENVMLNCSK